METNPPTSDDKETLGTLESIKALRLGARLAYAASGDGFETNIKLSPNWVGDPGVNLGVSAILIDGGDIQVTVTAFNVLNDKFEVPQTQWAGRPKTKHHLTRLSIVLRGEHQETHSIFYQVSTTGGPVYTGHDGEYVGNPAVRIIAFQAWLTPKVRKP